jgi:hypothetical protein
MRPEVPSYSEMQSYVARGRALQARALRQSLGVVFAEVPRRVLGLARSASSLRMLGHGGARAVKGAV